MATVLQNKIVDSFANQLYKAVDCFLLFCVFGRRKVKKRLKKKKCFSQLEAVLAASQLHC